MGGIGSGRHWHLGAKRVIEDYPPIDIRRWKLQGRLDPDQSFVHRWSRGDKPAGSIWVTTRLDQIELSYHSPTRDERWQPQTCTIKLLWTRCNLGGVRPWFRCPGASCNRRVARLYCVDGRFACRNCHQLMYPSQREAGYDRAARRANRIREKLGWGLGLFNRPARDKPKGMHWQTFHELAAQHDALTQTALTGIAQQFHVPLPRND